MLFMLAVPILLVVASVHRYLALYAPSNLLVRRVRARQARPRTVAALLALSAVLLVAMHAVAEAVGAGAPGWLNLVVLILAWDAIKIGLAGAQTMLCVARHTARRVAPQCGRLRQVISTRRLARARVQ